MSLYNREHPYSNGLEVWASLKFAICGPGNDFTLSHKFVAFTAIRKTPSFRNRLKAGELHV
jgi:hypothetical protein